MPGSVAASPSYPLYDDRRAAVISEADEFMGNVPPLKVCDDSIGRGPVPKASNGMRIPSEIAEGDQHVAEGPARPVTGGGSTHLAQDNVESEET